MVVLLDCVIQPARNLLLLNSPAVFVSLVQGRGPLALLARRDGWGGGVDQRVGHDLAWLLIPPLSSKTNGRLRTQMFPEIDWFSSSGFQSIFIKSYELLPGREGVDVLVLRHVHVEPPGARHDVALDRTLQGGGDVLSSLLQLRPPRDPEICQSVSQSVSQYRVMCAG